MQHSIRYSSEALSDLRGIFINITEFTSAISAMSVVNDIRAAIELLSVMPLMGVKGKVEGTREIYPRHYRVVYKMIEEQSEVLILTVLHTRRLYPPLA